MKKTAHIILFFLAVVAIAAMAAPGEQSLRRKARYYYLEGARKQAEGNMPQAYEYYKKAYMTDSSYVEAASAYGMNRLMVQTDSMQSGRQLMRSLALMRPYVEMYPADEYPIYSKT